MIVHIVFIKLKDENKTKNALSIKEALEALVDKVESLVSMEVGINFSQEARAFDLSLYSTFDTVDGLETYATHPEHLKVVEFIKSCATETKVVDYKKVD